MNYLCIFFFSLLSFLGYIHLLAANLHYMVAYPIFGSLKCFPFLTFIYLIMVAVMSIGTDSKHNSLFACCTFCSLNMSKNGGIIMIRYVCCLCISEQDSAKRTVLYGILIECCMARRLVRLIIVHFSLTNSHEFDLSLFLNFHLE